MTSTLRDYSGLLAKLSGSLGVAGTLTPDLSPLVEFSGFSLLGRRE